MTIARIDETSGPSSLHVVWFSHHYDDDGARIYTDLKRDSIPAAACEVVPVG